MAAKDFSLDDDLCCPVCCDIFKDPVVLGCSHSFCRACILQCWREKRSHECPICRKENSSNDPLPNLALRHIVESYLMQKTEIVAAQKREPAGTFDARCSVHGEKIQLFCEEDEELLCVVCQTSKKHRSHQICPVEEIVADRKAEIKTTLSHTKEKLEKFTAIKQQSEKIAKFIKSQAHHTERQVKAEFEKLHQFLRDEEDARLAALREEEEQKSCAMEDKIENLTKHVSTLSDKITEIQNAMDAEDIAFLKSSRRIRSRAKCLPLDPELPYDALIDVAKHLGNLKFRVWEKMLGMVQYTPVTLDPNTAHPQLSLCEDLTSVRHAGALQLPDNPERFKPCVMALGSEGFISGRHSWVVEVGNKSAWDLGVAKESVTRKGRITCSPERGFFILTLRNGGLYKAYTAPPTLLRLENKPIRIRIQLDYDRGEVSFFNCTDMSHIYTFQDTFYEKIFPYFNPDVNVNGSNPGALKICPAKLSVTVASF
ncbi:hypothetical protein AGOR_G00202710 [Albula goreensis]|uniref:Zinc-binding protein A33-like n=1 Tax=Albula goreensis TaxID=1534307 RepID=A0A8T3CWV5_9TELE|nr:hypothetical protein AGOR_G00202710 [Albula goreensis]